MRPMVALCVAILAGCSAAPVDSFVFEVRVYGVSGSPVGIRMNGVEQEFRDGYATIDIAFANYDSGVSAGPQVMELLDASGTVIQTGAVSVGTCALNTFNPRLMVITKESVDVAYSSSIGQDSIMCFRCEAGAMKSYTCP